MEARGRREAGSALAAADGSAGESDVARFDSSERESYSF